LKRLCVLIVLAIALIVLVSARFWPGQTTRLGAATPAECLNNYYASLKNGDNDKYLRCLGEPYRTDIGRSVFDAACRDVRDVKGVAQREGPSEGGVPQWVDVEEIRAAGVRRLRYHLRQDGGNWVITAIDPPRETISPVRYGTPVSDEP
jgi:hypothetical protein